MESISTPMKRMPVAALAHEIAGAAARLQDRGVGGHAQAGDGLVDGGDDGRRRVEGVESGALGAVVFRRVSASDFSSSPRACQPASLYLPVTGSGKIDRATGPKPREAGERLFFVRSRRPLLLLDGLARCGWRR